MNNSLTNDFQSLLYYQKALDYANENSLEKALLNIDKAINIVPKPLYILTKARILAQKGNFSEAEKILSLVPPDSEEFEEADAVRRRISKLKKPLNKITAGFVTKPFINYALVFFLTLTIFLIVLLVNEKKQSRVTQNLMQISLKTESISAEIDKLNILLDSKELVEKKDLLLHQSNLIDSLNNEFIKIIKQLDKINISNASIVREMELIQTDLKNLSLQKN